MNFQPPPAGKDVANARNSVHIALGQRSQGDDKQHFVFSDDSRKPCASRELELGTRRRCQIKVEIGQHLRVREECLIG